MQNDNTRGARGLCLEVHDLLAAKAIAAREKAIEFLRGAARHRLANGEEVLDRLSLIDNVPEKVEVAKALVQGSFASTRNP